MAPLYGRFQGASGVCAHSDWATSSRRREARGPTAVLVTGRSPVVGTAGAIGWAACAHAKRWAVPASALITRATMKRVSSLIDISPGEREQIRLDFYRAHRGQAGFSSVSVRRDLERRDAWFLDVGATGPVNVPSRYRGLTVRVKQAHGAINAAARRSLSTFLARQALR